MKEKISKTFESDSKMINKIVTCIETYNVLNKHFSKDKPYF